MCLTICFMLLLNISCENKSKIKSKQNIDKTLTSDKSKSDPTDSYFVITDSIVKSSNCINYQLFFISKEKKKKIYEIKNQDHSIEFKKKYYCKPLGYICYEINDLPTGLSWDILYEIKNHAFYRTEKYDIQAVGDTLDRKSVDFTNGFVKINSIIEKNKIYSIKLTKINLIKKQTCKPDSVSKKIEALSFI